MSDPALREKILAVIQDKGLTKICTRAELKAVFGMQQVSNSRFERALGSLCASGQLYVYRVRANDRGHVDYQPRVVSLHRIEKPVFVA